jgi:hypothetical protein
MLIAPLSPGLHEPLSEIQIRLVLIVGVTAQRDVAVFVSAAFPKRKLVVILDPPSRAAAPAVVIDKRATPGVAPPHLATN